MKLRLSKDECFVLDRVYNFKAIAMVMSPKVQREYERFLELGDTYPFRKGDKCAPMIGAVITEMPI